MISQIKEEPFPSLTARLARIDNIVDDEDEDEENNEIQDS